MANKKVYEALVKDLVPLQNNGSPIYLRFTQIRTMLLSLGKQYSQLLAEPQMVGDRFIWKSDYVENPVSIKDLGDIQKAEAQTQFNAMMDRINRMCAALRAGGKADYASIVESAVSVPDYSYILVEDGKIVLAGWGFAPSTPNGAGAAPVNVLKEKVLLTPPVSSEPLSKPISTSTVPPPISEQPSQVTPPPVVVNTNTGNVPPPPPPPPSGDEPKPERRLPGWLWFLMGALLMLLLFLLLRSCDSCNVSNNQNTPPTPPVANRPSEPDPILDPIRVVPPVDTTMIITDPDVPGDRPILSNAVNVALDRGVDVRDFVQSLNQRYTNYAEVVFADTSVKLLQVKVPKGEWRSWIDSLKALPEVKLAFPNSLFEAGKTPQDPGFHNPKQSWYFDHIEAYQAWDITTGDSSVIVAVADNCFELSHPEIAGKIVMPYNVTTGNDDIHIIRDDGNMHGTHVAGTAVGFSNGKGVCGIAPDCKLMPIQVADDNGMMSSLSIVAAGLYAIHHGASVVNFSLGAYFGTISRAEQRDLIENYGRDEAEFWNELFDFANEANCVFVLAAGNENILAGCDPFARSNKVLVVSAYQDNSRQQKASFSNHGEYANISAPGVDIYSSVLGGRYDFLQGTSMAAPIVTGAVALIKSHNPSLKAEEIVQIIKQTAKPLDTNPKIGPLLQLAKALRMAGGELLDIPENATDLSFAEGKWKSTSDLRSMSDERVEVYFTIKADGSGTIEYLEENGRSFSAPLQVKLEDGKLIMDQTAEAEQDGNGYNKCHFEAERQDDGHALCHAIYPDETNGADFYMRKIE